jgi:hypothetical protein
LAGKIYLRDVTLSFRFDLVTQSQFGPFALGDRGFQLLAQSQSGFGGLA